MKVYLAQVHLLCNLNIQKAHVFTLIEAAETLYNRNEKTNSDTLYFYAKTDIVS